MDHEVSTEPTVTTNVEPAGLVARGGTTIRVGGASLYLDPPLAAAMCVVNQTYVPGTYPTEGEDVLSCLAPPAG